jgi:hypothetical protein
VAKRVVGVILIVIGAVLALLNLLFLPSLIEFHRGEAPVVGFHVMVVLLGLGLAALGWRLVRHRAAQRG